MYIEPHDISHDILDSCVEMLLDADFDSNLDDTKFQSLCMKCDFGKIELAINQLRDQLSQFVIDDTVDPDWLEFPVWMVSPTLDDNYSNLISSNFRGVKLLVYSYLQGEYVIELMFEGKKFTADDEMDMIEDYMKESRV